MKIGCSVGGFALVVLSAAAVAGHAAGSTETSEQRAEAQAEKPRPLEVRTVEPLPVEVQILGTSPAARPGDVDDRIDERLDAAAPDRVPTGTHGAGGEQVDEAAKKKRLPFSILGEYVNPGTARRLSWKGIDYFVGGAVRTPVVVAHGAEDGPVVCLTGAVHGDELNGIEIVRRVMFEAEPANMSGTLVGVPIVNIQGFQRASRYLPDRRDLNRYFPGDPSGSSASRIAHDFFENIVRKCDELIDLHTGSFHRTNLTQLRADLTDDAVREMSEGFGDMAVLHNAGSAGTLRGAAVAAGIPAVTVEAGEPMRLDTSAVEQGVAGIQNYLAHREMIERRRFFGDPQPIYYRSTWVRADLGGILFSRVELGESVEVGDKLGTVTDPITNGRAHVLSPYRGTVLGMAVNQFVMPGFALFRIGVETSDEDLENFTPPTTLPVTADDSEHDEHDEDHGFGIDERPE
jgi:predicted deacylase